MLPHASAVMLSEEKKGEFLVLEGSLTEETIFSVVCAENNILLCLECIDEHYRAEDLFLVDIRFFLDVLKYRGLDKITLPSRISINLKEGMEKLYHIIPCR
jgi:hypothetical protein